MPAHEHRREQGTLERRDEERDATAAVIPIVPNCRNMTTAIEASVKATFRTWRVGGGAHTAFRRRVPVWVPTMQPCEPRTDRWVVRATAVARGYLREQAE
jgi:hypothetical protein